MIFGAGPGTKRGLPKGPSKKLVPSPLEAGDEDVQYSERSDDPADPDPRLHHAEGVGTLVGDLSPCIRRPEPAHKEGDEHAAQGQKDVG